MPRGFVVAILGAECTGKSTLAVQLAQALGDEGSSTIVVDEYLREFCDAHGRTPLPQEQASIAAEQTRRIDAAAATHALVIADTTALLTAVYSEYVFNDCMLYAQASCDHGRVDLTLLTALDLPWQPDGLQRDGPQVRAPVDALIRSALQREGLAYCVVSGAGSARLEAALRAVRHALAARGDGDGDYSAPRWHWNCERCGDAGCERHLLPTALS